MDCSRLGQGNAWETGFSDRLSNYPWIPTGQNSPTAYPETMECACRMIGNASSMSSPLVTGMFTPPSYWA